ncbi:MAG: hypothetical protein R3E32_10545 [Chitinophagales bacterium]
MKKIMLLPFYMRKKNCKQTKQIVLLMMLLLFILPTNTYAFEMSAGPDKVICENGETVLEGSASGSVNESYTFSWEPPENLSCTDCPDPTANPSTTTIYTLTVIDFGGFVCTDEVVVTVAELTVGPIDSDFETDKEGRIMISTTQDDVYYTSAQTEDGKVKITAYLTPTEEVEGQVVYFRTVDPDPDDASPYEKIEGTNNQDLNGGDNRDTDIGSGKFDNGMSTTSAVVNLMEVNGVQVAVAEVELTITDQYSGDNYQVEACLDGDFEGCNIARTSVLVAWKRVYLETAKMYRQGATILEYFEPDVDDTSPDEIIVDNTSDFNTGDEIELFGALKHGGASVEVFSTTSTIISKTDNSIVVNDVPHQIGEFETIAFSKYSGIKLLNNDSVFDAYTSSSTENSFGKKTKGEDGGCFVEFKVIATINIPKYRVIPTESISDAYLAKWSVTAVDNNRIFLATLRDVSDTFTDDGALSGYSKHVFNRMAVVFFRMSGPVEHIEDIFNTTISHELGHQFNVKSDHVDSDDPILGNVLNHEGNDKCIMSYLTVDDGKNQREFDEICIYEIRDHVDPI